MATRQQRFLKHRRRALNRARRMWRRRRRFREIAPGVLGWVGNDWQMLPLGMLRPHGLSPETWEIVLEGGFGLPVAHTVSAVGGNRPPHVKITAAWYLNMVADGEHTRRAFVGYHRRRVQRWGRKIGHFNGRKRRIMYGNWHAWRYQTFPNDDVLGRHPTEQDVYEFGLPFLPANYWPPASDYDR